MSGVTAGTILAYAAAAGTAYSIYNGEKTRSETHQAQDQARKAAADQADQADQANNRANQKRPDTMALLSSAQQAGKAGESGTLLTGPQGVTPNITQLGKSTLLGS